MTPPGTVRLSSRAEAGQTGRIRSNPSVSRQTLPGVIPPDKLLCGRGLLRNAAKPAFAMTQFSKTDPLPGTVLKIAATLPDDGQHLSGHTTPLFTSIDSAEEKIALLKEVMPRTLRSLFVLRICLCLLAISLAVTRIILSPPVSTFLLSIFTDGTSGLEAWARAVNVVLSGLLATSLALIIATFFIQAKLKVQAEKYLADMRSPT